MLKLNINFGVCIFVTISERHETVVQINCNNPTFRSSERQKIITGQGHGGDSIHDSYDQRTSEYVVAQESD
jgi:hypothetical protein